MYIEKIDELDIIINNCYNITNDAINLAKYILEDNIKKNNMLEIGTGSGYISIKLRNTFKNITAIDIQKESIENLVLNLNNNNIKNIFALNDNIKNHTKKYDVIISNPPFFKLNSGKLPDDKIKLISKFEKELNLIDLIKITKTLLSKNGLFYFIYPLDRLDEIIKEIEKTDLKILDIKKINKRFIIKGSN